MKFIGKLKKHTWKTAAKIVRAVSPQLAEIIDAISPDDKFPLYISSYPYGATIINQGLFYVPSDNGKIVPLDDPTLSDEIKRDLNFGGKVPVGLMLSNAIESYMDRVERITPLCLFKKGDIVSLWDINDENKSYQESPLWCVSSGSRAICMLPKITDQNGYKCLKKKYGLALAVPKDLYEHWAIFKYLANHAESDGVWSSDILYFSKEWFVQKHDGAWLKFYHHLLNNAWQKSSFRRNKMMFDYFFSFVQEKRNLKPSPYLADTLSHLISICSGEAPGLLPARDNTAAPISILQKIFLEDYRIKKYPPVIMHTHHLCLGDKMPIYYSFEMPTTLRFSPRANNSLTTMTELKGLRHITEVLFEEIQHGKLGMEKTTLFDMIRKISISFFHNEKDATQEIQPAMNLGPLDKSLSQALIDCDQNIFPESSPFFRGCVRISVV